jgi:Lysine methyltransferase
LVCAALGASVTLTDQECLMFLLQENKQSFCDMMGPSYDPNNIDIQVYDWFDKPNDTMKMPFDFVLVSECVLPKLYPIDILIEVNDSSQYS